MVGSYNNNRFTPEVEGFLDTHPMACFHCPRTLLAPDGRRIAFGVLAERRLVADNPHGWAGVLSLPRMLDLDSHNRLCMEPVKEVCSNSVPDWAFADLDLPADTEYTVPGVGGDCLELVAQFDIGSASAIELALRRSPGGEESLIVQWDRATGSLNIDTTRASLSTDTGRTVMGTPLALKDGDLLRLHVFVDRSVVEVFANRRVCASDRMYPTRPDSLGLQLRARDGRVSLSSLEVWRKNCVRC